MLERLMKKILEVLEGLDPENNDHWTEDGSPAMSVFNDISPRPKRADVTAAAPGFSRSSPVLPASEQSPLEALRTEVEKAEREVSEARRKLDEVRLQYDAALDEEARARPPLSPAELIRMVTRKQAEERAKAE